MKILSAPTESFIKTAIGVLAADAVAGSNVTLQLDDNTGFSNGDYIVIGREGAEMTELQEISQAVTPGQTVVISSLKFNHLAGEPVFKYRYNQRKFYGATTATGSYTELLAYGSPVTIAVDDPQGATLEYTGNEGYTYFKATYFNSHTSEETNIADAIAALADESKHYTSIFAIRRKVGMMDNPFYTEEQLYIKRRQAENEIDSAIFARYTLPLSEVPALISQICESLAAGYINFEEFGADGDGVKWLGEARALLKQIMNGQRRLLDSNSQELARTTGTGVLNGYPNSSDTDAAKFSMDDQY